MPSFPAQPCQTTRSTVRSSSTVHKQPTKIPLTTSTTHPLNSHDGWWPEILEEWYTAPDLCVEKHSVFWGQSAIHQHAHAQWQGFEWCRDYGAFGSKTKQATKAHRCAGRCNRRAQWVATCTSTSER